MRERLAVADYRVARPTPGRFVIEARLPLRRVGDERREAPPGSASSIRVVVVDDQEMVRAGFAALLGAQPDIEVVGTAADGAAGVNAVRQLTPTWC